MIRRNSMLLAAVLGMACTTTAVFADASAADQKAQQVFETIAQTPADAPDKLFVTEAAMGNLWETKFSELVASKATDEKVKQQATMIQQDHTQANQRLMQIAQKMKLDLPTELTSEKQAKLQAFAALSPEDLQTCFILEMKAGHLKDVTSYADHAKTVKDNDLRMYITSTLPKLQEHTQHVLALAGEKGMGQVPPIAGMGAGGMNHDMHNMSGSQTGTGSAMGGTHSTGTNSGAGASDAPSGGAVSADGSGGNVSGPQRNPQGTGTGSGTGAANARD